YVFVRSGNTWTQQAYLKAHNPDAGDQFGTAVSVAGDTAVVGASSEASAARGVNGDGNDNSMAISGAA
ncbi:MAG TPA: integrin, partial [Verrucomicrobiales bacterium]|nr:integrin [Verrucomicrobiales bacterium]